MGLSRCACGAHNVLSRIGTEEEAERVYNLLFDACPLEHGKTVSKSERQAKGLTGQKVVWARRICAMKSPTA